MNRLFENYKDYFRVGAALNGMIYNPDQIAKFEKLTNQKVGNLPDTEIAKQHFNLIVAENDTKMERVYKADGEFDFTNADKLIQFGKENGQDIRWHTLVWHSQSPDWIFSKEPVPPRPPMKPEDFKNFKMPTPEEIAAKCTVSKEELEHRLQKYIFTVGERYSKDICSVDVVNECISDKNFKLRTIEDYSRWSLILGDDYIEKAFNWAKEAFPKSSLVINDYNLEMIEGKRKGMRDLLEVQLRRGTPIDTVGLQMHIDIQNPPIKEIEDTIEMFGQMGLGVIVTEMEVSMYTSREEAKKEYTKELLEQQAERYYQLFECFKNEAKRGFLRDVVLWGITDRFSWKNNFPVPGRTDAPLLFDAEGKEKPALNRLAL